MALWYPAAVVNEATKSGGSFLSDVPFRGVLHTTEGTSFRPQPDSYGGWHTAYPHFTLLAKSTGVTIYQHLPINRAARALKNLRGGVQTNRACAIQIEIVGRAAHSARFSEQLLAALGTWMRWVEQETGVKRMAPLEFTGSSHGAGVNAPSRMSNSEWLEFDGWCGHQHVPENDHWDPGRINIGRLLAVGGGAVLTDVVEEPSGETAEDAGELVDEEQPFRVTNVSADDVLNVRSSPGLDGEIVGALAAHAAGLRITGRYRSLGRSTWVTVVVGGQPEGWVNSHYLTPDSTAVRFAVVDVAEEDHLNVRSDPGVDNPAVGALEPDERDVICSGRAKIVGRSIWVQIIAPVTGWVNSRFLRDEAAQPVTRSAAFDEMMDEIGHGDVERDSVYDE
jgi:uncharacterized protein YgiM (DUF1202 family)